MKMQLQVVVPRLTAHVTHPTLQNNLVQSLPANTPLTAHFQRLLSLAFFIFPKPLTVPPTDSTVPALIQAHIRDSPDYTITKHTDYSLLAARFSLLDVCIGPGLTTVPFRSFPASTAAPWASSVANTSTRQLVPPSDEEIAFDKHVDALTDQIMGISTRIVEDGAMSDMTRLDAKDAGERLYHRVNGAVRIGGPRHWDLFADELEPKQKLISRFFGRKSDSKAESVSLEVSGVKSEGATIDGVGDAAEVGAMDS
jgi:hypothetical protein